MSSVGDRRNDPAYWQAPVAWAVLRGRTRRPTCDDCLLHLHDAHGVGRLDKAVTRRRAGPPEAPRVTVLCRVHRDEWLAWTLGQMALL